MPYDTTMVRMVELIEHFSPIEKRKTTRGAVSHVSLREYICASYDRIHYTTMGTKLVKL